MGFVSLASFDGATTWFNSEPLTWTALQGRVVLVQFWTYTCINWLRTAPYIRAWTEHYEGSGLVVIGVHTPEFHFEQELPNVRQAVQDLGVAYPVAVDNAYAVWQAFTNHYWPALYFIDAAGSIRHHHFGEGDYERSERMIQKLLVEAGADETDELVSRDVAGSGIEAAADWSSLRSPESYVGYGRADHLASPGPAVWDRPHIYLSPTALRLNEWALLGDWTLRDQAAVSNEPDGRITCRFHARDVHLVMAPPASGIPARFRVSLDGRPPGDSHGDDIDELGSGTVREPRLYQLIRQPGPIIDRDVEIEFADPGAGVYVFTFG